MQSHEEDQAELVRQRNIARQKEYNRRWRLKHADQYRELAKKHSKSYYESHSEIVLEKARTRYVVRSCYEKECKRLRNILYF